MGDGPVIVPPPHDALSRGGTSYSNITITDSRALLGNHYATHNYYYDHDEQTRLLDRLSSLQYSDVHARLQRLRVVGTGSWLLQSDDYLQWRDGTPTDSRRNHSIWLYGPSGVGKTYLASNVIDDLRERVEGQNQALAYLYANRDRGFEQDVSSFLSSLARQLIECIPASERSACLGLIKAHVSARDGRSHSALLQLLKALAARFECVYVVFDALDEISDEPDDRLHVIEALVSFQHATSLGAVRMCMTSRQSKRLHQTMEARWLMEITTSLEDLTAFLEQRIASSPRLTSLCGESALLKSRIVAGIIKSSGGTFKIASLQIDLITRQLSRAAIKNTLERLPAQSEAYYQQALDRIEQNSDFGPAVKRMLGWLLVLQKPLTDEELAQAMGIESDNTAGLRTDDTRHAAFYPDVDDDELEIAGDLEDFAAHLPTLVESSEGFVVDYPSKNKPIVFDHPSARNFLRSRLVTHGDTDWNADIARTFLRYICSNTSLDALEDDCLEHFAPAQTRGSFNSWYSLLVKAVWSWTEYASVARQDLVCYERELVSRLQKKTTSPLMLCCMYGWSPIIRLLAQSNPLDPFRAHFTWYSPFHIAVNLRQTGAIHVLFECANELDVDRKGFGVTLSDRFAKFTPALFTNGYYGDELSPNVTSHDPLTWSRQVFRWGAYNMLQTRFTASSGLDEEDVWRSMDRRLNAHDVDESYVIRLFGSPPLHLAVDCPSKHPNIESRSLLSRLPDGTDMLKTFLDHLGSDVNALGFAGFTPLLVSIHNCAVEATRVLIGHPQIDINLVTRTDHALSFTIHRIFFQRYESPQKQLILNSFAANDTSTFRCLFEILTMLLDHPSVEVHRADALGYTALDWLNFYRNLADNEEAHAFVDSDRDWVDSTGREIAGLVLDFYNKCDAPFSRIAGLLEEHGAKASKAVEFEDWLRWFCPPPQQVEYEHSDSDADEVDRSAAIDVVYELYYLRMPFADGCEEFERKVEDDALTDGSMGEDRSP